MATATLLTPTELRDHIQTDLVDLALQRVLDAEESEIIRRYGAHASQTEMLTGGNARLGLSRQAASVTSVTEVASEVTTVLAADDYRLWYGTSLERLMTGTNPRQYWGDRVTVVYVPTERNAQRTLALVNLCKLTLAYEGVKSQSIGQSDYSMTAMDYRQERERILRSLASRGLVFA